MQICVNCESIEQSTRIEERNGDEVEVCEICNEAETIQELNETEYLEDFIDIEPEEL